MDHLRLRFALAIDQEGTIKTQHFGAAENFILFEFKEGVVKIIDTIENPHQHGSHSNSPSDHQAKHGHKASFLIPFLKEQGVQVLVSNQFGSNIRKVIEHFVVVLSSQKTKEGIFQEIHDQFEVIKKEWMEHSNRHHIIRFKEGKVIYIPLKA